MAREAERPEANKLEWILDNTAVRGDETGKAVSKRRREVDSTTYGFKQISMSANKAARALQESRISITTVP